MRRTRRLVCAILAAELEGIFAISEREREERRNANDGLSEYAVTLSKKTRQLGGFSIAFLLMREASANKIRGN